MTGPAHRASQARPKITLERAYPAAIDRVWELWTTRDGIESWWGPEGFEVEVRRLDLRPGGELLYAMRAVGPDQIEFMNKAGMPLLDEHRVLYMQVEPPRRLVYKDVADFIPGVKPYEVETTVELEQVAEGTRLVVTFEAMHDEHWTRLAVMGKEMELDKLGRLLEAGGADIRKHPGAHR